MIKVIGGKVWDEINRLAKKATIKYGAIAYVSSDTELEFGNGDVLICDASNNAIKSAQTDAKVLKRAFDRGAELYTYPGLHSKLLYIDGYAVIGSANVSQSSMQHLFEAVLITNQQSVAQQTLGLINDIRKEAASIDDVFLHRAAKLSVTRAFASFPIKTKKPIVKVYSSKPTTWLVGAYEDVDIPEERTSQLDAGLEEASENLTHPTSEPDWLIETTMTNYSHLAKPGDYVIYAWRQKSTDKQPRWVYTPCPILKVKRFSGFTGIYTETFKDAEKTKLSWPQFMKLAKQVGIRLPISANTERQLTEAQAIAFEANWKDFQKRK